MKEIIPPPPVADGYCGTENQYSLGCRPRLAVCAPGGDPKLMHMLAELCELSGLKRNT